MGRYQPPALTRRGRGVLASGVGLIVAALITRSPILMAAGTFILALVILAAGFAQIRRHRAFVRREPPVRTASVGQPLALQCRVRSPGGPALVSGLAPLGVADHSTVRLATPDTRLANPVTPMQRGQAEWPPLVLELPDPFGIVHGVVRQGGGERTLVLPRVEQLDHLPVVALTESGEETGGTIAVGRWTLTDPAGNPIPREYRVGDDLRRVHWPATARSAEPMVRAEDAELGHRAALTIDIDSRHYADQESFERAIVAVGSMAVFLLNRGWTVSCRGAGGHPLTAREWVSDAAGAAEVLTCLALLDLAEGQDGLASPIADTLDVAVWVAGSRPWLHPGEARFSSTERLAVLTDPVTDSVREPAGAVVRYDGSRSLQAALTATAGNPLTGIGW